MIACLWMFMAWFCAEWMIYEIKQAVEMNDTQPQNMSWRGRPLTDLTRDELLIVVVQLHEQLERSHENFTEIAALNQRLLDRQGDS